MATPRAELLELRVLDGPNLYFPRPAVKLTIGVGGWLDAPEDRLSAAMERAGASGRTGRPRSDQRRRTVARLASRLTSRLATASSVRLAVRSRTGPEPDQVVVAFPWRRSWTRPGDGGRWNASSPRPRRGSRTPNPATSPTCPTPTCR